jgi:hypothetical protein
MFLVQQDRGDAGSVQKKNEAEGHGPYAPVKLTLASGIAQNDKIPDNFAKLEHIASPENMALAPARWKNEGSK